MVKDINIFKVSFSGGCPNNIVCFLLRWGPKGAQRYEDNCERLLTTVAENFRWTINKRFIDIFAKGEGAGGATSEMFLYLYKVSLYIT